MMNSFYSLITKIVLSLAAFIAITSVTFAQYSTQADTLWREGLDYFKQGEKAYENKSARPGLSFILADKKFRDAQRLNPTRYTEAMYLYQQGRIQYAEGKYQLAAETFFKAYRKGVGLDAIDSQALSLMKLIRSDPGQATPKNILSALKAYDKAINARRTQSLPVPAILIYERGNTLHMMKEYGAAFEDYFVASKLEPENKIYKDAVKNYQDYYKKQPGGTYRIGVVNDRVNYYRYYLDSGRDIPSDSSFASMNDFQSAVLKSRISFDQQMQKLSFGGNARESKSVAEYYRQLYKKAESQYRNAPKVRAGDDDVDADDKVRAKEKALRDMQYYKKKIAEAESQTGLYLDQDKSNENVIKRLFEAIEAEKLRQKEWKERDYLLKQFRLTRQPEYISHN